MSYRKEQRRARSTGRIILHKLNGRNQNYVSTHHSHHLQINCSVLCMCSHTVECFKLRHHSLNDKFLPPCPTRRELQRASGVYNKPSGGLELWAKLHVHLSTQNRATYFPLNNCRHESSQFLMEMQLMERGSFSLHSPTWIGMEIPSLPQMQLEK